MKTTEVKIELPVFLAEIRLVIGKGKSAEKRLPEGLFSGEYTARCAVSVSSNKTIVIIHSKTSVISSIAHEAVHAAGFILERIGSKADYENDEVFAYIVQYICEEAEKALGFWVEGKRK